MGGGTAGGNCGGTPQGEHGMSLRPQLPVDDLRRVSLRPFLERAGASRGSVLDNRGQWAHGVVFQGQLWQIGDASTIAGGPLPQQPTTPPLPKTASFSAIDRIMTNTI